MKLPKKVTICEDVTRDGFQSAAVEVAAEEKARIIEMASEAAVSYTHLTLPTTSRV